MPPPRPEAVPASADDDPRTGLSRFPGRLDGKNIADKAIAQAVDFAPLPRVPGGWACVNCDAPLHFATWSPKGQGRAPSRHYETQSPEVIMRLPLQTVVAEDAWLWLWWPDPHLPRLTEAMCALGFEFSGKGFTWIKTLKSLAQGPCWISTDEFEAMLHMGGGLTTRKNSESCWLGRRGNPKRLSKGVREIIIAPRREHSRKPEEFYQRVEEFCPGPRLDLFTRETRASWTPYGDEAGKFDRAVRSLILKPGSDEVRR